MSRIDVVPTGDGKFKVLVNFIQHGVDLKSAVLANLEAKKMKAQHYPKANVTLSKTDK